MARHSPSHEALWQHATPLEAPELPVAPPPAAAGEAPVDDVQDQEVIPSREDALQELQMLRQQILADAEQQAQHMLAQAREAIEQEMAAAKQQGYEQGLQEGREIGQRDGHAQGFAAGYQSGQERSAVEQRHLQDMLGSLSQPMHLLTQDLQEMLGTVVREMVTALVHRELAKDSSQAITKILEALPTLVPLHQTTMRITVHPQDIPLLRQALQGQTLALLEKGTIEIIPDQELTPGGLQVETDTHVLDWSVKSQLEAMFARVLG